MRYRAAAIVAGLIAALTIAGCQSNRAGNLQQALDEYNAGNGITSLISVAESGNREAQALVGVLYGSGEGVKQDYKKAFYWQLKAAEQGHVKAQYNVAVMYSQGMGTRQNLGEAAAWFQRAADQNLPEARMHLGLFHEKGWVLRKCPYAASSQYFSAGQEYLKRGNIRGARKALAEIRRLLPGYYLASELETEIYMYEK